MTVGAVMVVMVVVVDMMPVHVECPAMICVPPTRPVAPIPGRVPANPVGTPEPVVDNRNVKVSGFNDIVHSVDVLVADHLNDDLVVGVFLYIDRGYVLKNVLRQHSLEEDEVLVAVGRFYDTEVIHFAVAVEVEVGEVEVFAVEFLLEFFQISTLTEECSHGLEVQVL
jgi:hypothetical protein